MPFAFQNVDKNSKYLTTFKGEMSKLNTVSAELALKLLFLEVAVAQFSLSVGITVL